MFFFKWAGGVISKAGGKMQFGDLTAQSGAKRQVANSRILLWAFIFRYEGNNTRLVGKRVG